MRRLNRRHLLHPGADTRQIVAHYILSIRCMRVIDPQGVLLDLVARPIRLYLRSVPTRPVSLAPAHYRLECEG